MNKTKIILVDDHKMIAETLGGMIAAQEDFELIAIAFDGKELLEKLETEIPDVLVLDIEMPKLDGIQTMKILRTEFPAIRVLALSNYTDPSTVRKMIEAGARGYILKNRSGSHLVSAIRKIEVGETAFDEAIKDTFINSFSEEVVGGEKRQRIHLKTEVLSDREIEILKFLADGLRAKEMADRMCIEPTTVNTHKKKIMDKLGLANDKLLVRFAVEQGLVDRPIFLD